MSKRIIIAVISPILLVLLNMNPAQAKDDEKAFYTQVEKLEKIAKLKSLEAEIVMLDAKIEEHKAKAAKAKAQQIWAQVNAMKGKLELDELMSDGGKRDKTEKK